MWLFEQWFPLRGIWQFEWSSKCSDAHPNHYFGTTSISSQRLPIRKQNSIILPNLYVKLILYHFQHKGFGYYLPLLYPQNVLTFYQCLAGLHKLQNLLQTEVIRKQKGDLTITFSPYIFIYTWALKMHYSTDNMQIHIYVCVCVCAFLNLDQICFTCKVMYIRRDSWG
jgi:hypothetical protein